MKGIGKLILHPDFEQTLKELCNQDIMLPHEGGLYNYSSMTSGFPDTGKVVQLEDSLTLPLDAKRGTSLLKTYPVCGYDESWLKFTALEGTAYFTSHALVLASTSDYVPIVLATFNFYTRSHSLVKQADMIKLSENVEVDYHRDYLRDKVSFLLEHTPKHCILLIDGPLISGDLYTIMSDSVGLLLDRDVLCVHFVKNSLSNIVTENNEKLKGLYNSDMHWLNDTLTTGERSSFYLYQDLHNPKNAKVFSYVKTLHGSPQRIEFHHDTFRKYHDIVPTIMDLVYYLVLVQGSHSNPQVRPIAIAEKYARSILHYIDIHKEFKRAKLTPTMDQVRFGG